MKFKNLKKNIYIFYFIFIFLFAQTAGYAQPLTTTRQPFFPEFETDFVRPERTESLKNQYNEILRKYYNKGKFDITIAELTKTLNDFPNDIKDDVYFTLAKCYYKIDDTPKSFRFLQNILLEFPRSKLISNGSLEKTILNIIKIETDKTANFTFIFSIKLYHLLRNINASKNTLNTAERYISRRLNDKIKIPFNLEKMRITDYENFKISVVNQIWDVFFPSDFWMREAFILTNMVSLTQIENSFNYYAKDIIVKLIIKDVFNVQSIRYIGYGLIETTPEEFFKSLNLKLSNFLNENTDLFQYKDEL